MICSESRQRENCLSGLRLLFGLAIILISVFAIISFSKVFYALIPFGFLEGFCGLRSLTGGFDIYLLRLLDIVSFTKTLIFLKFFKDQLAPRQRRKYNAFLNLISWSSAIPLFISVTILTSSEAFLNSQQDEELSGSLMKIITNSMIVSCSVSITLGLFCTYFEIKQV